MKTCLIILLAASLVGCRTASVSTPAVAPERSSASETAATLLTLRVPAHVMKLAALVGDYRTAKKKWPKREEIGLPPEVSRLVLTEDGEAPEMKNLTVAVYDNADRPFRFEITPSGEMLVSPAALGLLNAMRAATTK
jgi:hypothetical protein